MATKRKPYIREMNSDWWRKLPYYRFYMLRELTAVPAIWFSILLIYGLSALKQGEASFACFVQFLANPIVLLINVVALMAALLQTTTWFTLAPKVVRLSECCAYRAKIALWGITGLATIILLFLAL
ncbi:MAG: fumarate reductase subunit C [Candidatus Desulfovibrio kirbyi]|jgi:fumarate reductase subunit C|uniref:Fumarate reductase subunit C n=1 Tax=Candidatus Desulfovibrio kirbyi TaxID=2696086 RepID=A0A6L2R5G4_9BACT|nr:fumarate reductase subunit FrdC [Desulfovibrio sp.]GFH62810.1 MAG: fumarate reductase subunit C [Candidatus Desulfovibrio kirbyi]